MGYYIYYSQTVGEARIHSGDCPDCKHGFVFTEASEQKGEWLGPFSSYHDAESAAEKTKADVHACAQCMP